MMASTLPSSTVRRCNVVVAHNRRNKWLELSYQICVNTRITDNYLCIYGGNNISDGFSDAYSVYCVFLMV